MIDAASAMANRVSGESPVIPPLDHTRFIDVDIYGQEVMNDPWRFYEKWANQPPFYVMVYGRPNAMICRHQEVRQAFLDHKTFSAVPQPGWGADYLDYFNGLPVITELDPPDHNRQRRLMQPAFTPHRIAQLQAGIDTLVEEMLERAAAGGSFDMMTEFAQPLAHRLLLGTFFEFPPQDWPTFTALSEQVFANVRPGAPRSAAYMNAINEGYKYCSALIEERRRQPTNDLIGNIVSAHDEGGRITTEELFSILLVLFSAGLGTISGTLSLCILRLCRHPDQLQLLRDNPALINSAIEECLRIDSLAVYRHRYVMKDVVMDGVPLYRGMIVHLSIAASNYDPCVYPDPYRFDIQRDPKEINTFGFGAHFCIGRVLARAVVRTAVGRLVQRFPNLRLADPGATIVYGGATQERLPLSVPMRV
jgi:cytochrome P450